MDVQHYNINILQQFIESGSKKQSDFENVVNPPLITGDPDKKLIDVSCDSELHLLLGIIHIWFICLNYCEGIVEKIMREFEKRVFCHQTLEKTSCLSFSSRYAPTSLTFYIIAECLFQENIVRKSYQGGQSLEVSYPCIYNLIFI